MDAAAAELSWNAPIVPSEYGVDRWEPNAPNSRGQVLVWMATGQYDDSLIEDLRSNLDSQGMEEQRNTGSLLLKFWTTNPHVAERKLELAARIIRRWRALLHEGIRR